MTFHYLVSTTSNFFLSRVIVSVRKYGVNAIKTKCWGEVKTYLIGPPHPPTPPYLGGLLLLRGPAHRPFEPGTKLPQGPFSRATKPCASNLALRSSCHLRRVLSSLDDRHSCLVPTPEWLRPHMACGAYATAERASLALIDYAPHHSSSVNVYGSTTSASTTIAPCSLSAPIAP